MDKALRRFHAQRWKNKMKHYWVFKWELEKDKNAVLDPRHVGITAKSRARCSSYCCGNPRKFWKDERLTIQEKKHRDIFKAQLEEYGL